MNFKSIYKKKKNQSNYIPQASTWKYVPGSTTGNCNSRIPCYSQKWYNYWCAVGCSPVAWGMIMWYYDRNGKWKLVDGQNLALDVNTGWDNPTDNMIQYMRWAMNTICSGTQWSTHRSNVQKAKYYAINNGYWSTSAYYHSINYSPIPSILASWLKPEIDAGRPLILHLNGVGNGSHSAVVYAYNTSNNLQIKLNAGWWNGNTSSAVITLWFFSLTINNNTYYFTPVTYTKFQVQ